MATPQLPDATECGARRGRPATLCEGPRGRSCAVSLASSAPIAAWMNAVSPAGNFCQYISIRRMQIFEKNGSFLQFRLVRHEPPGVSPERRGSVHQAAILPVEPHLRLHREPVRSRLFRYYSAYFYDDRRMIYNCVMSLRVFLRVSLFFVLLGTRRHRTQSRVDNAVTAQRCRTDFFYMRIESFPVPVTGRPAASRPAIRNATSAADPTLFTRTRHPARCSAPSAALPRPPTRYAQGRRGWSLSSRCQ